MHLFAKISPTRLSATALLLGLLTTVFGSGAAHAAPAVRLAEPRVAVGRSAALSPLLSQARLLGRLDAAATLHVGLTLPLRNQGQLTELIRRQYTAGDPLYHQFLKPEDFTARFGPTQADYDAVAAYARASGLTITQTSPGRTLLAVSGPSARIESAFGIQMARYQLADGREAYVNRGAPLLPRSVAAHVTGVVGLNNLAQMRPLYRQMPRKASEMSLLAAGQMRSGALEGARAEESAAADPNAPLPGGSTGIGSGALGGLTPNDIKYAYSLSAITPLYGGTTTTTGSTTLLNGKGQIIGLFELDGFVAEDIATYISTFSLPATVTGASATVTAVPVNGFSGKVITTGGRSEVTLDIDMVLALAPAANAVYVYEDDQITDPTASLSIFTRMANDLATDGSKKPLLQVISCSWGLDEPTQTEQDPTIIPGENTLFQQMAAQGQSVFCSTGDSGAYPLYDSTLPALTSPVVNDPASQPYATGVGGTTLSYTKPTTNTAGVVTPGTYQSETVWSSGTPSLSPEGSGGGVSGIWPKPGYQQGFGASGTNRDVPDVALNADPNTGYVIYLGGTDAVVTGTTVTTAAVPGTAGVFGGTSASAPLWAGYMALINQQRSANGLGPIGFVNPTLYSIGGNRSAYAADFHDIITGSNLFYDAGPGYDDATGFGSFIGNTLLTALSVNPNQGTGTATITGTVTDTSATPVVLAGVTVKAIQVSTGAIAATTTTNASGAYTLTVPSGVALNLTADPSTIASSTTSYLSQTVNGLTLTASQSLTENFALGAAHTFAAGLQMISAPFDYTGLGDFATLFGLTVAQASSVSPRLIQYSPSTASYVYYPTAPADTLRLGQGYWIRFPSATGIRLAGVPLTAQTFSIPLQAGWNQIGDPFTASTSLSNATVIKADGTPEATLALSALVSSTLYRYDATANAYVTVGTAAGTLDPYSGYWVYAFSTATLNVTLGPPGAPGPPSAPG